MVRFNISTYTTPLDDEKKYKNKLKLIHRFHKIATIKESVDNKENIIKVSSSSDNDFIQHFITLRHSTTTLNDNQIKESFDTLQEYGNLTGVSIPTVLDKAMFQNNSLSGKGLLIGITMGFGLDIVEVEKD